MELGTCFKKSKIGIIPKDWEIVRLADIGKVVRGASPRPAGDPRFFNGNYIPWLTVADITNLSDSSLRVEKTQSKLTEEGSKRSRILENETVLIANSGATLGVAKILGVTCCANDGVAALVNQSRGSKEFICYFINTRTTYLRNVVATGNGQPNLNTSLIKEIVIPFPPLPEQQAIANALSDADALIESLEQLIEKKRQIKQGVMQELLTGKRRLPGFSGEWIFVRLGDIADPDKKWSFTGGPFGSNLKSSDYTNCGVRIIQLQNIGDAEFKDDYKIFTSVEKADELLSSNIYPGEIILSKMGDPVARACIIPKQHSRYLMCSDGIRLAVNNSRFSTYFVFTQINAPDFRNRAANAGTGSTRKRIGLTELRNLVLYCPSNFAEQVAIADILGEIDYGLASLDRQRSKICEIKKAMMQELLTGKVRLV